MSLLIQKLVVIVVVIMIMVVIVVRMSEHGVAIESISVGVNHGHIVQQPVEGF
jgi:hypothetical protein